MKIGVNADVSIVAFLRSLRDRRSIATREIHIGVRRLIIDLNVTGTILDVGAGRAPWRTMVRATRYMAFDVAPLPGLQFVASITDIPLRDGVVDMMLCTEVLEHIIDTPAALREMHRVLPPGGYLVLTTPLLWGVHDVVDYYRWTADGLRYLLAQQGFTVMRLRSRGGLFNALAALIDQIPYQLISGHHERFITMSVRERTFFLLASTIQLILTPFVWAIAGFDVLDRQKRFTLGYIVLAKRI